MSKIPSPHFLMKSQAIIFSLLSLINFGIVYISAIYQSLDQRICFKILFFNPKESCTLLEILIFLGGAPTSLCHFFCLSVRRAPYLRNRTLSNRSFC